MPEFITAWPQCTTPDPVTRWLLAAILATLVTLLVHLSWDSWRSRSWR